MSFFCPLKIISFAIPFLLTTEILAEFLVKASAKSALFSSSLFISFISFELDFSNIVISFKVVASFAFKAVATTNDSRVIFFTFILFPFLKILEVLQRCVNFLLILVLYISIALVKCANFVRS